LLAIACSPLAWASWSAMRYVWSWSPMVAMAHSPSRGPKGPVNVTLPPPCLGRDTPPQTARWKPTPRRRSIQALPSRPSPWCARLRVSGAGCQRPSMGACAAAGDPYPRQISSALQIRGNYHPKTKLPKWMQPPLASYPKNRHSTRTRPAF
jgi:hypothetical protein